VGAGYGIGYGLGIQKAPTHNHKFLEYTPEYQFMHNHPFIRSLRADGHYVESRYCDVIPKYHQGFMVTSNQLSGPGLLTVEPLVFTAKDNSTMYVIYHVGDRVRHHRKGDPSVHNGFIATLMDEGLSRCAFSHLPHKYGVTASLDLSFEAPLRPDSYLVLKAASTGSKGRKAWAEGTLCVLDSVAPAECVCRGKVIMVEPKWAKYFTWLFGSA
jgi:acyl-coenzyme A thioesterase PaaI-like protein